MIKTKPLFQYQYQSLSSRLLVLLSLFSIDLQAKSISLTSDDSFVSGMGHLNEAAEFQASKISKAFDMEQYVQGWTNMIRLFSKDEEIQRQRNKRHRERGVLKSGEGSAEQIMQMRRQIEERENINTMLRTGEPSDNPDIQRKFYEHYIKHHNQNSVRNDDVDLIPYTSHSKQNNIPFSNATNIHQFVKPLSLQQLSEGSVPNSQSTTQNLQQTIPNQFMLVEPYPSGSCQNNGQVISQTQLYYQCAAMDDTTNIFRVDQNTYLTLSSSNYTNQYSCYTQNVTRQVCMCPQGYYGSECGTQLLRQCLVNITDPPLSKGCSGMKDSPYYLYSVPGYDPCFFLDFTQVQTIKYLLTCQYTNKINSIDPEKENIGYSYRDVVSLDQPSPFVYVAQNNITNMKVMEVVQSDLSAKKVDTSVRLTIYDWKWLSQPFTITVNVTDPEVLVGITEQEIKIDFPKLMKSDSIGLTKFIAGGRAYYEADVKGSYIYSYISKGFFDQAGYVEPTPAPKSNWTIIVAMVIPIVVLGFIISALFYQQQKKKNSKKSPDHLD